jgi:hypothetical protein
MTGGPMPYVIDVGPYISVLEHRLNTPAKRAQILADLRGSKLVWEIAGLDSQNLNTPATPTKPASTAAQRIATFNQLWFGMKQDAGGRWNPQPNAFPTGHWNGFQGDTHEILRQGLICAIEVSLGVDHQPPATGANQIVRKRIGTTRIGNRILSTKVASSKFGKRIGNLVNKMMGKGVVSIRDWPIDISWICQGPFFQCWVTWMATPSGGGHVSLTITTPAAKGLPVGALITRSKKPPDAEYKCPPPPGAYLADRGAWVIGHEDYTSSPAPSTTGSGVGGVTVPTIEYRPKSPNVICVAPAEWEGGVLAAGRPYIP